MKRNLLCFCLTALLCTYIRSKPGNKQRIIEKMCQRYKSAYPGVQEISVRQLIRMRKSRRIILVDVRPNRERTVARIPGAIPANRLGLLLRKQPTAVVVSYCTIGYRSGIYTAKLIKAGIRAYNLRGSILAWVHAGQAVIDASGKKTHRIHVYGKKWDLLPPGYRAVW